MVAVVSKYACNISFPGTCHLVLYQLFAKIHIIPSSRQRHCSTNYYNRFGNISINADFITPKYNWFKKVAWPLTIWQHCCFYILTLILPEFRNESDVQTQTYTIFDSKNCSILYPLKIESIHM